MEEQHLQLSNLLRAVSEATIDLAKTVPGLALPVGFLQSLQKQCKDLKEEDLRNISELAQNMRIDKIQELLAELSFQNDEQKKHIRQLAYAFAIHVARTATIPASLDQLQTQMGQVQEKLDRINETTVSVCNTVLDMYTGTQQTLTAVRRVEALVSNLGSRASSESSQAGDIAAHHTEIDKARDFLLKKKPDVTIVLLEEMRTRAWDRLTAREKYRLEANLGHAHIQKGLDEKGAEYFLKAAAYQPDDSNAHCLEIEAYVILKDYDAATKLADATYAKDPQNPAVVAWWIRTRPPSMTFKTVESGIAPHLRTEFDVALALAQMALAQGDEDSSERHARCAIACRPSEPYPHLIYGNGLFERERRTMVLCVAKARKPTEALQEAIRILSHAYELSLDFPRADMRANILLVRGAAYKLAGQHKEAEQDIVGAFALLPSNPETRYNYALLQAEKKDWTSAIDLLSDIAAPRTATQSILLADILNHRSQAGDRTKALTILSDMLANWDKLGEDDRTRLTEAMLRAHIQSEHFEAALKVLTSPQISTLPELQRLSYKAGVELHATMREEATTTINAALRLIKGDSDDDCVIRVAYVCHGLGRYREAFDILSPRVRADSMDIPAAIMLDSGVKCGKEAFVLDFCSELRHAHIYDMTSIDIELATLLKFNDYPAAVQASEDILANASDPVCKRFACARRSDIGVVLERPDLIETDPRLLPSVGEGTPATGRIVARALTRGPNPNLGVQYAYELYRRYPNQFHACAAVVESLGPFSKARIEIVEPAVAGPGTAVTYQDQAAAKEYVCVIEDSTNCNMDLHEFPPTHGIVVALAGKKVGETFEITAGRPATIGRITDKYVYRWNQCLQEMYVKFPDQTTVWPCSIGDDPQLSTLVSILERYDKDIESALKVYRENVLPAASLARAIGKATFVTVELLGQSPGLPIRSCQGNQEEINASLQALGSAHLLVIDATTLATLFATDAYRKAFAWPIDMSVSQGTFDEIRLAASDHEANVTQQLMLVKDGMAKRLAIIPVEGARDRQRRLKDFLSAVELKCRIESGKALADVDSKLRDVLVNLFGRATAETMALAMREGSVMWVDDLAVAAIAQREMNIRSVWTQIVFQFALVKYKEEAATYFTLVYDLLQRGYIHTFINSSIIIEAVKRAKCVPSEEPLLSTLDQLANKNVPPMKLGVIAGLALPWIWRNAPFEHLARHTTATILNRLDSLPRGREVIMGLYGSIDVLFFIDAVIDLRISNGIHRADLL